MKSLPAWLWVGTPFKFVLWLVNRVLTATGMGYAWKRLRLRRHFWVWLLLINGASLSLLALAFYWLHRRVQQG